MSEVGALSGYRVLDLTDRKGMFCPRLLADMGAEVIRVEAPGESPERSPFFPAANLSKRSVTLDIKQERGRELFRRLAQRADVVVESQPPGHLAALGIGYRELGRINPRLVMASITDFGQNGPRRDYRSGDIVASALGGQAYVCGELGLPPLKPAGELVYYSAGLFAATGVLLALWSRRATGEGQHVDISAHECAAATLDHVLVRYFYEGVVAGRQGSLYWNSAFRILPCRDGYILLSLFQQWETLVEWLASEGMAEDLGGEEWRDRDYRREHLAHVIGVLERWTQRHTVAELVEKGQLMRFPWAEVSSIPQLVESPQLVARGFWVDVEHPPAGKRGRFPGAPCRLSRSPWRVGSRAPEPGEDNIAVYQGELGLSEDEMATLAQEGVI